MPYLGPGIDNGFRSRFIYTATAGQTSFSGGDANGITLTYTDSEYLDVYQNGVLLVPGDDYAATTGTTVVLVQGASLNDKVEMIQYQAFGVADTVSRADGGAFGGNISTSGTLAVTGTSTLTGNTTVGGTLGVTGIGTFTDDIIIGDGKTIGSASDIDAMTIASGGGVTFSQKPTFTLGNRGYTHIISAGVAVGGTAASSLGISSTYITSAYTNYMLVLENVQPSTDNQILTFRPSVDNGSNFTAPTKANLRYVRLDDGGNIGNVDGDANGVAALTVNSGNDATSGCSGIIHLNGFTDATNFKYFVGHTCFLEASNQYTGWFAAAYNTTTAFNHINIIFASGNIRSGFIHLYGLGE